MRRVTTRESGDRIQQHTQTGRDRQDKHDMKRKENREKHWGRNLVRVYAMVEKGVFKMYPT